MRDIFITCYWNYYNDKKLYNIAKNFINRNPNVIVLEGYFYNQDTFLSPSSYKYNLGNFPIFADYIMINKFLNDNLDDKENIRSITLIDIDIILNKKFFRNINECHKKYNEPVILQCYKNCHHYMPDNLLSSEVTISDIYNYKNCINIQGHTGYTWSFNNKLLELINYKFPECFLIGGFDYILSLCVRNNIKEIKKITTNELFLKEINIFYNKIKDSEINYVDNTITHIYNGDVRNRLTPWNYYKDLTLDKIIKYFEKRNIK